jgi:hypothetical protein
VSDVLVDHDSVKDFALVQSASWNLLNFGISFDFQVQLVFVAPSENSSGGLQRQVSDEVTPSAGELCSDATLQCQEYLFVVVYVNCPRTFVYDVLGCFQGLVVG